ncbi:ABC transporter permease [Actinomadura rupiterrae]|uniref:ABC transporter permease n=1 Tax=Actinomadura rupiterrae TaxID=559627 RepID=UPI0020A41992|nr:ABC transporter permease [Actinomadura rupiterrae]MCP2343582.1 hypothetical protein [Actinomadura rupiterrae]
MPATRRVLVVAALLAVVLRVRQPDAAGGAPDVGGYVLVQVLAAALGALSVTSEYATGMIRLSLVAVPRRGRVLAAKAVVCSAASFLIGALSGPAGGLYLALAGVTGVATGFLVRSATAAWALLVGAAVGDSLLVRLLPDGPARVAERYSPTAAGDRLLGGRHVQHVPSPWAGAGLLAAVALIALASALVVSRHREH